MEDAVVHSGSTSTSSPPPPTKGSVRARAASIRASRRAATGRPPAAYALGAVTRSLGIPAPSTISTVGPACRRAPPAISHEAAACPLRAARLRRPVRGPAGPRVHDGALPGRRVPARADLLHLHLEPAGRAQPDR